MKHNTTKQKTQQTNKTGATLCPAKYWFVLDIQDTLFLHLTKILELNSLDIK